MVGMASRRDQERFLRKLERAFSRSAFFIEHDEADHEESRRKHRERGEPDPRRRVFEGLVIDASPTEIEVLAGALVLSGRYSIQRVESIPPRTIFRDEQRRRVTLVEAA